MTMSDPKKDKKCTFCNIRGDKIAKGTHENNEMDAAGAACAGGHSRRIWRDGLQKFRPRPERASPSIHLPNAP